LIEEKTGDEEEFFVVAGSLMTALGFKVTTILPLTLPFSLS
jgi:hypothetical protein